MSDPVFTPTEKAALDRFAVPPLSAGFADRVVAASADRPVPDMSASPWQRRSGRRSWRRASIIGGGIALSLLSAAAAATGYLGEPVRQAVREAPVIGPIIARVAPVKADPVRIAKAPKAVPAAKPAQAATADPVDMQRAESAQRIVDRIKEVRKERREAGLPARLTPRERREVWRSLPPEDRKAVADRVRELRQESRAAWPSMSSEERAAAIENRRALRQQRRQMWMDRRRAAENAPREGSDVAARYQDQAAPSGTPEPDAGGAVTP